MQFQNVIRVAQATPTSVLCEAWGADTATVLACQHGERLMTIAEVGALAEVYGLELLDVLTL